MFRKKMRRIFSIILAAGISVSLLSACKETESVSEETTSSETTISETTAKYSDEELELLAQDMPEIVFVLAYQKDGYNILGCYVMNTGDIKLFDFRTIAPNEVYDVRDVYNRLEEATCDRIEPLNPSVNYEERLIVEDELTPLMYDEVVEYYKILLPIEGNAEYIKWDYSLDSNNGSHLLYGIKRNKQGEKECILLRGYGTDSEYLHNNPDAEYLYAILFRTLPKFKNNTAE